MAMEWQPLVCEPIVSAGAGIIYGYSHALDGG